MLVDSYQKAPPPYLEMPMLHTCIRLSDYLSELLGYAFRAKAVFIKKFLLSGSIQNTL